VDHPIEFAATLILNGRHADFLLIHYAERYFEGGQLPAVASNPDYTKFNLLSVMAPHPGI